MRAFTIRGPRDGGVEDVDPPDAGPGQVVVDVARVGLCGTDVELFAGTMPYLLTGAQAFPVRPGHEWCGVVSAAGEGVDRFWLGRRVTGDTMLGCGKCTRCGSGRHHVCEDRYEIGIRGNWPGALAERLLVPAGALRALPDALDDAAGALVEPGGCALRAVEAAAIAPGHRVCVFGPGTLGLLAVQFAAARGAAVEVVGVDRAALAIAADLGAGAVWTAGDLPPGRRFDAVIDASNSPDVPGLALRHVEPAGRVVLVGLADRPSLVDSRDAVLGDVTVVGILAASAGLDAAIAGYAGGGIRTAPLVGATVGLGEVAGVLAGLLVGERPAGAGPGPKIQVDPRRSAAEPR